MDIGLNVSGPELWSRADAIRDLGVTWVKFGCDVDSEASIAHTGDLLARAAELDLRPVVDLRTDRTHIHHLAMEASAAGSLDPWGDVSARLAEVVHRTVSAYRDACRDWEWWGEPYCPHVTGGAFSAFDYGVSLRLAYEAAHGADPDCRVWTGGFGVNLGGAGTESGMRFLTHITRAFCPPCKLHADPRYECCPKCAGPLRPGAGKHFDIANLHPYAHGRDLGSVLGHHDKQLTAMRTLLDEQCAGQPFAATEWGFPTVPVQERPPWLASFVLTQGVQALCEADAPEWFDAMFALFARHKFEVVCVHTLDDSAALRHWGEYCGLYCAHPLEGEACAEFPRPKRQLATVRAWARGEREVAWEPEGATHYLSGTAHVRGEAL